MQGDELRALRKAAGMTQGEFADQLGLSQGFVGEMERGEKQVERRTAFMAKCLAYHAECRQRLTALDATLALPETKEQPFPDRRESLRRERDLIRRDLQWMDKLLAEAAGDDSQAGRQG